jgi:hypothetical protein
MSEFTVSEACFITGRGTVVFLAEEPRWLPWRQHKVTVTKPGGDIFEAIAQVESARRVPPGEVAVLLFKGIQASEFPRGTIISTPDRG